VRVVIGRLGVATYCFGVLWELALSGTPYASCIGVACEGRDGPFNKPFKTYN